MFYNVPSRKAAMRSAAEEYGRLLGVVQAYALDNTGVAVSCRKGIDGGADLATSKQHTPVIDECLFIFIFFI